MLNKPLYCFAIIFLFISYSGFAKEQLAALEYPHALSSHASERRAQPAPFDSIFPGTEYLGPTIGVPNSDPIYPMTQFLWKDFSTLKDHDIRIYGWVNPAINASTSKQSNIPAGYTIVPNRLELQQTVLRLERVPDTVQTNQMDWGFRFTNLYGVDYRFTTSVGYFSEQLFSHNELYGYDLPEAYWQLYIPSVAQGIVITVGRYLSPSDIESQLSPDNYLVTHSLMFIYDTFTQTGANAAIKFNDTWSAQLGFHWGNDIAPWADDPSFPTLLALIRWVSSTNNDSLWGGVDSYNGGEFKGNHTNLQQFNVTWSHRFTEKFFTETEAYYLYQINAAKGGTCNFGPSRPFAAVNSGCGAFLPGYSDAVGGVNFIEYAIKDNNFVSFRTDYLNDPRGALTGFATYYMSWTLGLTHMFTPYFEVRPEVRYEKAFAATPYDNGTKQNQTLFALDAILQL